MQQPTQLLPMITLNLSFCKSSTLKMLLLELLYWLTFSVPSPWNEMSFYVCMLSHVQLFKTPRTVAFQAVHGIFQARILEWENTVSSPAPDPFMVLIWREHYLPNELLTKWLVIQLLWEFLLSGISNLHIWRLQV